MIPPGYNRASKLAAATLTGVLYALAQSGPDVMGFICLIPLLLALRFARVSEAFLLGIVAGGVAASGVGWWVPGALQEVGSSKVQGLAGLVLIGVWAKGLPFGAAAAAITWSSRYGALAGIGVTALAFAMIDFAHLQPPWGVPGTMLGHTQSPGTGLSQLAVLGGVPLLSAIVALGNALAAEVTTGGLLRSPLGRSVTAATVGALGAVAIGAIPLADRTSHGGASGHLRVLAVQPNLDVEELSIEELQETHLRTTSRLVEQELTQSSSTPAVIVLPENIVWALGPNADILDQGLADLSGHVGVPLLVGVVREVPQEMTRSTVFRLTPDGRNETVLEKAAAMPLIESARRAGGPDWATRMLGLAPSRSRVSESEVRPTSEGPFAIALCFEALFPGLVRARTADETRALLALTNDTWFAGVYVAEKLLRFASYRAIENQLPLIRVAHGGPTAWVDSLGRLRAILPAGRSGSLLVDVPSEPQRSQSAHQLLVTVLLLGGGTLGWGSTLPFRIRRIGILRRLPAYSVLIALVSLAGVPATGQPDREEIPRTAVLTLDELSFVSFGDHQVFQLASGGTIEFSLASPADDGSVPFSIAPSGVSIEPIVVDPEGASLAYGLVDTAHGSLTRTADGSFTIEFSGRVSASLSGTPDGGGTREYQVAFTTEEASARDDARVHSVSVTGARLSAEGRAVQLVGAATNQGNAYPQPGTAVYTVLSGTFDPLPVLSNAREQ